MKNLFKYVSVVFCLFLLVGCGAKDSGAKDITFDADYIRTDGNIKEVAEPVIVKIKSVKELEKYYNENKDNYNLTDNSELSASFATEIDKYDEEYFNNNILLFVLVQEESSAIYHTVNSINDKGSIIIDKKHSDKDSNDIATWHIVIEVSKEYQDIDYKVTMRDAK